MIRIRVSVLAERDLDAIWHFIAMNSGSVDIADGVIESITSTFLLFAHMPVAGTKRDEIDPGVRAFPVDKYIIYYRQEQGEEEECVVAISRVIHGMRDQPTAYRGANTS